MIIIDKCNECVKYKDAVKCHICKKSFCYNCAIEGDFEYYCKRDHADLTKQVLIRLLSRVIDNRYPPD